MGTKAERAVDEDSVMDSGAVKREVAAYPCSCTACRAVVVGHQAKESGEELTPPPSGTGISLRSAHRVSLTDEQAAALLDRYCTIESIQAQHWGSWVPPSPLAREALELLRAAKERLRHV